MPKFLVKSLPAGVPRVREGGTVLDVVTGAALVQRLDPGSDETALESALVSHLGYKPATHFVGFCGEEYLSARRVFGLPDFFHVSWDSRAAREIAPGDLVVFGPKADPDHVTPHSHDDSNELDDPARLER
jgi:hypothetical protein